jgi:sarcosine oxidase/L-pipecolate oxidase
MEYHEGLGKDISVPPVPTSQSTFGDDVPVGLKEEVQNVVKNTYGNAVKGIEIVSYRMCW